MGNSVILVTKYKDDTPTDEYSFAYDIPIDVNIDLKGVKSVYVSSDGLGSFINPDPKGQIKYDPMWLMENHFSKLKNTTGEFLKRRCGKAIKRFEKNGIVHYDDFSMGAFLLED